MFSRLCYQNRYKMSSPRGWSFNKIISWFDSRGKKEVEVKTLRESQKVATDFRPQKSFHVQKYEINLWDEVATKENEVSIPGFRHI